ncbi:MAG: glycosyltransferase [Candidatus Eisenbacteria bacterium]
MRACAPAFPYCCPSATRPWLASSLASLRRQSFTDFEIVAVDDGSRDGSGEALERAARDEPRLRVLRTPGAGLPAALNTALAHARGSLFARHDADDLSHRDRFAAQVAALDARPGVDVVGSRVRLFPARAFGAGMRRWQHWHNALLEHDDIVRELLIDSPIAHGCVVVRREALERVGGWHERGWAEDLDLWIRLAASGARFEKLPRTLYGWRQHERSSTRTDARYARERFTALKVEALDRLFLPAGRTVTLFGVGESLRRWEAALGARVALSIEAKRPPRFAAPVEGERIVLAFMSPEARSRWRRALVTFGWTESRHFIFVA